MFVVKKSRVQTSTATGPVATGPGSLCHAGALLVKAKARYDVPRRAGSLRRVPAGAVLGSAAPAQPGGALHQRLGDQDHRRGGGGGPDSGEAWLHQPGSGGWETAASAAPLASRRKVQSDWEPEGCSFLSTASSSLWICSFMTVNPPPPRGVPVPLPPNLEATTCSLSGPALARKEQVMKRPFASDGRGRRVKSSSGLHLGAAGLSHRKQEKQSFFII